jgi:hypothetical protein
MLAKGRGKIPDESSHAGGRRFNNGFAGNPPADLASLARRPPARQVMPNPVQERSALCAELHNAKMKIR